MVLFGINVEKANYLKQTYVASFEQQIGPERTFSFFLTTKHLISFTRYVCIYLIIFYVCIMY